MPVISQGCPELIFFNMLNTDSGLFHLLIQLSQFHFFANSLKIEKSDRAIPGAGRTFFICPIRRSELINVPSFLPSRMQVRRDRQTRLFLLLSKGPEQRGILVYLIFS